MDLGLEWSLLRKKACQLPPHYRQTPAPALLVPLHLLNGMAGGNDVTESIAQFLPSLGGELPGDLGAQPREERELRRI